MNPLDADFDAIRPGSRFETQGRTLTEADLVSFSALTGDHHPQHTDAEWAARSRFGERVAHGMLLLSYAVGLVPLAPERVAALRAVRDAVFKRPARIGDTIHVEGEIVSTRPLDPGHGLVACRWRVVDQRDRLLARVTVEVLWLRSARPSPAPGEPLDGDDPVPRPVLI